MSQIFGYFSELWTFSANILKFVLEITSRFSGNITKVNLEISGNITKTFREYYQTFHSIVFKVIVGVLTFLGTFPKLSILCPEILKIFFNYEKSQIFGNIPKINDEHFLLGFWIKCPGFLGILPIWSWYLVTLPNFLRILPDELKQTNSTKSLWKLHK